MILSNSCWTPSPEDISRDGPVDTLFPRQLVQFVYIDDAVFSPGNIPVGSLNKSQKYVLNVFTDVPRLGQRRGVANSEGHI